MQQMIPIYLKGEISQDSVIELMDRLSAMEADTATVYISCWGGDWNATQVLMNYLETWFEAVHIVISGYCISAAWRFALLLKNAESIVVLDGAYACDHLPTVNAGLLYSQSSNYIQHNEISKLTYEKECEDWTKLCKQEFNYTAQELKDLKAGKNVYFDKERAVQILEAATFHRKT